MVKKKKPSGCPRTASKNKSSNKHTGNSAHAQRQRVLAALMKGPLTTIQIRRDLDVMMPGARIHELKQRGHRITTHMVEDITDYGAIHRVGLYVLHHGEAYA